MSQRNKLELAYPTVRYHLDKHIYRRRIRSFIKVKNDQQLAFWFHLALLCHPKLIHVPTIMLGLRDRYQSRKNVDNTQCICIYHIHLNCLLVDKYSKICVHRLKERNSIINCESATYVKDTLFRKSPSDLHCIFPIFVIMIECYPENQTFSSGECILSAMHTMNCNQWISFKDNIFPIIRYWKNHSLWSMIMKVSTHFAFITLYKLCDQLWLR